MFRVEHRVYRVALLVGWSRVYGRGVLRGIGRYVQAHRRWKVYHSERKLSETARCGSGTGRATGSSEPGTGFTWIPSIRFPSAKQDS